jgi:hypothetical protein
MKTLTQIFTLALLLGTATVGNQARAHEGHDHGVPGVLKPQKGGRIKPALGGLLIELVVDKASNTLKLFPFDKDYKPVALKDVKVSLSAQRRRVDKVPVELKTVEHNDHFMANFDPKGRYPFNVDLKVMYKAQDDTIQFIVDRN